MWALATSMQAYEMPRARQSDCIALRDFAPGHNSELPQMRQSASRQVRNLASKVSSSVSQHSEGSVAAARPVSYPRVGRAIRQADDGPVPAESEIFRGWITYGPAAMPLLKVEQRAGLCIVPRHLCKSRLRL